MGLAELNEEFGKAEQAKDTSFFANHLADNLVFRRASGATATKEEFLAGLASPGLIYHEINTEIKSIIKGGVKAAVEALVTVDMTKDGNNIKGSFKNVRFFEDQNGTWKLVYWYNEKA